MPTHVLHHFKETDAVLYAAIRAHEGALRPGPEIQRDLFASLCRTIVGQQLSGKAARAIWEKFRALFPRKKPTAAAILDFSDEELRESGLSHAKIRSLKDLSECVANKSLALSSLRTAHEDDVREQLQHVRGIGPWSCEMFLMFALGREDIFSSGDLGLRKGMQKVYEYEALPDNDTIEKHAARWSPYRTYAACALWSILDNQ